MALEAPYKRIHGDPNGLVVSLPSRKKTPVRPSVGLLDPIEEEGEDSAYSWLDHYDFCPYTGNLLSWKD